MDTLISVILPSRKRVPQLLSSTKTLLDKAAIRSRVEIVVGYDSDDFPTANAADLIPNCQKVEFERLGYHRLHEYVNRLAEMSSGKWLFLWNDDAQMLTEGWDIKVSVVDPIKNPIILTFDDTSSVPLNPHQCCFPLLSRVAFDLWGHYSLSNHCDAWLQDGGRRSGMSVDVDINIHHDRFDVSGNNDDETYREGQQGYRIQEYLSHKMQSLLNADVARLKTLGR